MVFAAASLSGAFEELARAFEAAHPDRRIELHCAGTPQLVVQLREGAPADLFASADEANMQRLTATRATLGEPRIFARNHLCIVVARSNPKGVHALADLRGEGLRVVLCGPEVPAGRYAREALGKAGVAVQSLSDEPSVKAVVAKVELGEADAGIVYVTDARAARERLDLLAIPPEHDVEARYPLVVLDGGAGRDAAQDFAAFVLAADGQAILERWGFTRW